MTWILCSVVGMILGMILRKKFRISKKVDGLIVFLFAAAPLIIGLLLINLTSISIFDQRVYIPSTCWGLGFGWCISSLIVKRQDKKA